MKNAVGRELPAYIEGYGKVEPFTGAFTHLGVRPRTATHVKSYTPGQSKLLSSLEEAIEKAGSIDHEAIRDAMSGMHYVGVTGDMTLDEAGTPEKSVAILTFTPSDGKLVQKFVKTQS